MKLCRDLYFLKQNHGVSRTSPLHVSLSVNEKNHYQGYVPEFNLKNYCTGLENNIYCHSSYEEETCNSKVVSASVHHPQSRLCVVHCQCKGKGKTFFKQRKCLGYHPERSGGRECLFLVVIRKCAWWPWAWPILAAPLSLLHQLCSAARKCVSLWTVIWVLRSAAAYTERLSSSAFQTRVLNPFHQF